MRAVSEETYFTSHSWTFQVLIPPFWLEPTLTSFPEAALYQVAVFDEEKQEAVMQAETAETSLAVTPALTRGGRYQWSVSATNAKRQSIAYFSSWMFLISA